MEGQFGRVDQLIETCPTKTYECVDMAYQRRVLAVHLSAMEALYELETAFLRFQSVFRDWNAQQVDALLTEGEPATDAAADSEVARRVADCVIIYRATSASRPTCLRSNWPRGSGCIPVARRSSTTWWS